MTGAILWFTGLSGAGKTTLAQAVAHRVRRVRAVEILDGDDARRHLSKELGFTREDRDTNVHRIAFVARLLARHGVFVIAAAISPYKEARDEIRALATAEEIPFIEVFVNATLTSLMARDVKGLYKRAIAGEIAHFTGVSDPYEPPDSPEIVVNTDVESVEFSTEKIVSCLIAEGLLDTK